MSIHTIFKSIQKNICNDKVISFKTIINDVVNYPEKLNEMPALVSLFYRDDFDIDKLQNELKIDLKDCVTKLYKEKEFLSEVTSNNADIGDLETIIRVGINDGIGESEITFHLDEEKLETIKHLLGRTSTDEDYDS